MKRQFIIRGLMILHVIGIVIMAGTTLIDYLTFHTFWKLAGPGDDRSLGLLPLMAQYGAFIRTGAVMLMITGVALLVLQKTNWRRQFWFKIKLGLFFLLLLNGILVGNTQGHRFRQTVTAHAADFAEYTQELRKKLNIFYSVQLTLFIMTIATGIKQTEITANNACLRRNSKQQLESDVPQSNRPSSI